MLGSAAVKKLSRLLEFLNPHPGFSRYERHLFHLVRYYGDAIMGKIVDATAKINQLTDQMQKIREEIQAVKDAAQNVDTPPEFDAALERLSGLVQSTDDDTPDAVPPGEPTA